MTTYIGSGLGNPFSDATVTGGHIPGDADTGHRRRFINDYADYLEPWETIIYSAILGSARKYVTSQTKIENGRKEQRPLTVALNANYSLADGTLDFGTTNIKLVQKNMVFDIEGEILWADDDPDHSAGTISVQYAQAGTSNAAHASGVNATIIGTATTFDGPTYPDAPSSYGSFVYNHPQRFASQHPLDDLAIITDDLEKDGANKLSYLIEEEMKYQKLLVNRAIIYGKRQEGALGSSAKPSLMGGIPQYLTSNVTTVTPSGANLDVYHIEDRTASIWNSYRRVATTMVMNMNTKRIWNRLMNPYRQGSTMSETSMNLTLDTVTLETGTYTALIEPEVPDGEIWGLDFSGFDWVTYKDHDWAIRDTTDPTRMRKSSAIVGVFSMLMPMEPIMWKISGFNQTLNAYPKI